MSNDETIAELKRQIRAYEATVHNLNLQLEAVGAGGVQALVATKYQAEHVLELVAAPDLLDVLKELAALDFGALIMNDDDERRIDFVARKARAAIAKAEGGAA